jgi:cytochrome P460
MEPRGGGRGVMARICLIVVLAALAAAAGDGPQFTAGGELVRPDNYREWIYLSSGLGMSYSPSKGEASPKFDNVFVNPAAYRAFLRDGKWPDQTVLVLEVRESRTNDSINQAGRTQGDVLAIEAEVKDSGKWTFYGFGKSAQSAKAIPAGANCYACHSQHGAVDNTFVQFYPTLRAR